MISPATHYRPSHRISLLLFPIALAISGVVALGAAPVYAHT